MLRKELSTGYSYTVTCLNAMQWSNGKKYLYQTLIIWLGIKFRQHKGQIKDRKPKQNWNIFGLAQPWDPRGQGTYSKFCQSPLMIDLWKESCIRIRTRGGIYGQIYPFT